jgi:hypothetical protein
MLITQDKFSNGFVFVNIFVDRIGRDDLLNIFLTLTKGFNDKWSGFEKTKELKEIIIRCNNTNWRSIFAN